MHNLHLDLSDGKMETLQEYIVPYRHVMVDKLTEKVGITLLVKMCKHAAVEVQQTSGREYGFADPFSKPRATECQKLTQKLPKNLPTDSL